MYTLTLQAFRVFVILILTITLWKLSVLLTNCTIQRILTFKTFIITTYIIIFINTVINLYNLM